MGPQYEFSYKRQVLIYEKSHENMIIDDAGFYFFGTKNRTNQNRERRNYDRKKVTIEISKRKIPGKPSADSFICIKKDGDEDK